MLQDKNYTERKLQELENTSLPDLSKMEEHWKEMKVLLQSETAPAKSKHSLAGKHFRWVIAAIFSIGILFLLYALSDSKKKQESETIGEGIKTNRILNDTIPSDKKVAGPFIRIDNDQYNIIKKVDSLSDYTLTRIIHEPPPFSVFSSKPIAIRDTAYVIQNTAHIIRDTTYVIYDTARVIHRSAYIIESPQTIKNSVSVIESSPLLLPNNSSVGVIESSSQLLLNNFFKHLEKQPQQFVIDARKDTLIEGKEGSALLIPANTFDSQEKVMIHLKEFYSYQDIILHKLSTTSDGQQLITGGMIHLSATVNGKEVNIQPHKSIRWFIRDTIGTMNQMQIFTGIMGTSLSTITTKTLFEEGKDSASFVSSNNINWIPQNRFFSTNFLETRYKVLNLSNEPYKTRITSKGLIGKFYMSANSEITKEELQELLCKKYGYYKVKIKGYVTRYPWIKRVVTRGRRVSINFNTTIGDSSWLPANIVRMYRLDATDTITYMVRNIGNYTDFRFARGSNTINLNKLANRFSIDIRTLGWINCDRFYDDNRLKVEYAVNLGDTASNYFTFLVFDKYKSMMQGMAYNKKVVFSGVPKGEKATVISVGVKDGKTIGAFQQIEISQNGFSGLKFEETSPAEFKEEVKLFDK